MNESAPFHRIDPPSGFTRAVFSSPHSGRRYPPDFVARARLSPLALRASEDAYVEELFADAPRHGAPLIVAHAPRAYIDLNRAPDELDPALIEGVDARGLNARVAAGLGVIPRVVAEGKAIQHGKLSRAEAEDRLLRWHAPFHAELDALVARAAARHGAALLFDCHSMPSDALRAAPRQRGKRPDIVLGDRFGAAAAPWVIGLAQEALECCGFTVARNAPFAGGWITQKHGRPQRNIHAVQIEIDRGLYLDEARVEKRRDFEALRAALAPAIAAMAMGLDDAAPLAAE